MLRLLFSLFLIPFFSLLAGAQAPPQRCFKAFIGGREVTEICVNTPVKFVDCSNTKSPEFYDIDNANGAFDNPVVNTSNTTFTFSKPGTYVVTQLLTVTEPPGLPPTANDTFIVRATPPPAFTAIPCGPNQVKITIQDATYDSLYLFLNNGNRQVVTNGQIITLSTSGSAFTLKLQGKYRNGNCGGEQTQTITPPAPVGPVKITKLKVRPNGILAFTFSGLQSGYKYQLQDQSGNIKSNINFNGSSSDTLVLGGQNTSVPACFQIVAVDYCDQTQGTLSPVICSTVVQATAQNNENLLTWPAYAGGTPAGSGFAYALFRRENNTPGRIEITPASYQALSFTDNQVSCGTNYCYELEITDATGGFSISDKTCVTAISTDIPPTAALITSFGTDNILTGTVTVPTGTELKSVQVLKNANGQAFANFSVSGTPDFKDPDKNFKPLKPCYQVKYTDNCGNTSAESNTSCPVILTCVVDKIKRTATLTWSAFVGFNTGTEEYTLELLDENFVVKRSEPVSGVFTKEEKLSDTDQILRYRIKVSSGTQTSYSNLETIIQEVKIFVPNAFSPNGDGLNDVFEVKGRFQNNFSLLILNRWGEIVFESRDPRQGWNGLVNGKPALVGVYAYRLRAFDETGRLYETTGTLTLVK